MVPAGLKRIIHACKQAVALVENLRGLAVHKPTGRDNLAAKGSSDGLMPEADAEDGDVITQGLNSLERYTCILRAARSRGNHECPGVESNYLVQGDHIVAPDQDFLAKFLEILNQIEGERIVVVDDEYHCSLPLSS
jgi:hypothetical protein